MARARRNREPGRKAMRRALIAVLLAGAVAVSTTKPAEARWGWGWGWGLGAFAIVALIGAALWGRPTLITIRPTAITPRTATATAIRPTATVMATRTSTAATTGLTTADTTAATMATGERGGRHPSCFLALRKNPRSPLPAPRILASTAAACFASRHRLRLARIHLSGYRGALLVSRRDDARRVGVAATIVSRLRVRLIGYAVTTLITPASPLRAWPAMRAARWRRAARGRRTGRRRRSG